MLHSALPHPRCTRVLRVLKNTPDEPSKLLVEISILDLDAIEAYTADDDADATQRRFIDTLESIGKEDYDALSYTWGSQFSTLELRAGYYPGHNVPVEIIIDGLASQVTKIGRNLYEALDRIWDIGRRRWTWVDALCISQDDILEKAQHVLLMSEIYSRALGVIVWIGVDDPDLPTCEDIHRLTEMNDQICSYERATGTSVTMRFRPFRAQNMDNVGVLDP